MVIGRTRRVVAVATVSALLALVAALALAPGAVASTKPPHAPPSRWQLVDYAQRACFSPNVHDAYFGIYIDGSWTSAVNIGASGLPSGGSFDTSYAPIAPGSSTGEYSLAYVHVMFATTPAVGIYTASMWASDGRTTRQVPIVLDVRTRCGY
jgi:hypothetical protein